MPILRVGWLFWRNLSANARTLLLEKYEIHTVSEATFREQTKELNQTSGKAKK